MGLPWDHRGFSMGLIGFLNFYMGFYSDLQIDFIGSEWDHSMGFKKINYGM